MKTRMLGTLAVSKIGFGTMSFASTYGDAPDRDESIRVIRGAYARGVTFFDTAEAYGPWTNEELVGEALKPLRRINWIVPIPGTRKLYRLEENLAAAEVALTSAELAQLTQAADSIEIEIEIEGGRGTGHERYL